MCKNESRKRYYIIQLTVAPQCFYNHEGHTMFVHTRNVEERGLLIYYQNSHLYN